MQKEKFWAGPMSRFWMMPRSTGERRECLSLGGCSWLILIFSYLSSSVMGMQRPVTVALSVGSR